MARSNSTAAVLAALLTAAAMQACMQAGHTYSSYKSMGNGGWLREDTVAIDFGPLMHGGQYAEELGLRTDSRYPFMEIAVIVEQQARPSGFSRKDTVYASLTDSNGHVTGEGISHHQYIFNMPAAQLAKGDTLHVDIRHNMRRSPLKGITDVGLTIKNTDL